jgi:hypothetical protein
MKYWLWFFLLAFTFTAYGQVSDTTHSPPNWMVWQEQMSQKEFSSAIEVVVDSMCSGWSTFCLLDLFHVFFQSLITLFL